MEFEEIENGIKAKIPLITEEDIRVINNDFDGIVNRFSKMIIKDKDLAKAQYIIKKQQEQMEELKRNSISIKKAKSKIKEVIKLIEQEQFKIIMGDTTICNRIKWILEKELLEEDE